MTTMTMHDRYSPPAEWHALRDRSIYYARSGGVTLGEVIPTASGTFESFWWGYCERAGLWVGDFNTQREAQAAVTAYAARMVFAR